MLLPSHCAVAGVSGHQKKETYFNGKILMAVGLMGLILKLMEPLIIIKGCFGYDYVYEFISFGMPIILFLIGFRIHKSISRNSIAL